MRHLTALCVSLLLASPAMAQGQFKTGAALLAHCEFGERPMQGAPVTEIPLIAGEAGLCRGYVLGVLDTVGLACLPFGTTVAQVVAAAMTHLRDQPKRHGESAAGLVYAGVARAFPCT